MTLSGVPGDITRGAIIATVNPMNNLPTTTAYRHKDTMAVPGALTATVSNTSIAKRELK